DPEQRPPVSERESEHLDVEQLCRGKVSELVDHHEHADEQQKIQDGHELKTARRAYSRTGILLDTWRQSRHSRSRRRRRSSRRRSTPSTRPWTASRSSTSNTSSGSRSSRRRTCTPISSASCAIWHRRRSATRPCAT